MKRSIFASTCLSVLLGLLGGCGSHIPPKYSDGQYVPPPSKRALQIDLRISPCNAEQASRSAIATALVVTLAGAVINQTYDTFVNWLDEKKANMSVSSTGVATTSLLDNSLLKRCLVLTRANSMQAMFSIEPTTSGGYWHMTPYSLKFSSSEAKEKPEGEKSIVADIQFATPSTDGTMMTFFQGTFDLGIRTASPEVLMVEAFVGQDSGPFGLPKVPASDSEVTIKITASLAELGEGRDWIRGVTDSLREKENREKILKPILDALDKKTP